MTEEPLAAAKEKENQSVSTGGGVMSYYSDEMRELESDARWAEEEGDFDAVEAIEREMQRLQDEYSGRDEPLDMADALAMDAAKLAQIEGAINAKVGCGRGGRGMGRSRRLPFKTKRSPTP